MFLPARLLLVVLFTCLGAMFLFSRFHHVFLVATAAAYDEVRTQDLPPGPRSDYRVRIVAAEASVAEAAPPDVSRLTTDNISALAPAVRPGTVVISPMRLYPELSIFIKKNSDIQRLRLTQRRTSPRAIVISEGSYDFTQLVQAVNALAPQEQAFRKEGDVYTLRLPLLIAAKASLTISARDLKELRLSQERGVFIANAGDLFILRAKVTGWSEAQGAPIPLAAASSFRPFVTAWSGARLYIAGSVMSNLGYDRGEAQGIVYAACHDCLKKNPALSRPIGAVVESVFADMYQGLQAQEADDIVVVRNRYINSALAGIRLQDGSRRMIVADNEVYGSRKSPGISISRNVSDSWILRNSSHDNGGPGIALERAGARNIVAGNIVTRNKGDGISICESSGNTTRGNVIFKNGQSGIRIRNSADIRSSRDYVVDNASVPVLLYASQREAAAGKNGKSAAVSLPPANAVLSGSVIRPRGHREAVKIDKADRLVLSDMNILSGSPVFSDGVTDDNTKISAALGNPRAQVILNSGISKAAD